MATVVERIRGHYDVQEVDFGRVYRWCPERIVAECGCGAKLVLTASAATCGRCGADLAPTIRAEPATGEPDAETLHPWRYEEDREDAGLPW